MLNAVIFLLGSIGAFALSVSTVRKRWRFTDTPTSDAAHVFPGLSEVHGTVEAIGPTTTSPATGEPCVWWSYEVERKVKTKNGTSWVQEEHGVSPHPFAVRDKSGAVRVVPDELVTVLGASKADVEHLSLPQLRPHALVMTDTYTPGSLARTLGGVSLDEPVKDFGGAWRANESRLVVGQQVFITARARLTPDLAHVELAPADADGKRTTFEVSVGDEEAAKKHLAGKGFAVLAPLFAVGLAVGAGAFWADARGTSRGGIITFLLVTMAVTALVMLTVGIYNRVHRVHERVKFAWSLIEVASQQRADLVPSLNTVVVQSMRHEADTLTAIAAARAMGKRPSNDGVRVADAGNQAAERLVVAFENNPNLQTQTNTAQLMNQVRLLNDRVAFGRRFYNDSVEQLANRVGQFPDSLVAKAWRITPPPFFMLTDPPEVTLP